jgi:hypothetical protein
VVNFLPSFALSAIVKDYGSRLDCHFVNTEKMQMYGGCEREQPEFCFFMKNDRAQSKDSSLDNPSCDERMIPREPGASTTF